MEIKRLLGFTGILVSLAACGGQGTEVVSPPNPSESPGPQQIETPLYEVKMDLPVGWTYTEYGPDVPPGPETFRDIDPETVAVAQFSKGGSGFTVFYSVMAPEEILEVFVRSRRPVGEIRIVKVPDEENDYVALFNQEEPGPHDGFVVDVYASVNQYVLWLRAEAVGSIEEQDNTLNEFFDLILPSIEFRPKF